MSYKVSTSATFRREAKRLLKKYPSLHQEISKIGLQLSLDPKVGISIGNDCYKIRIPIKNKGKGKRGGARLITHLYVSEATVFLLSIFDKPEKSTMTALEIKDIIKQLK